MKQAKNNRRKPTRYLQSVLSVLFLVAVSTEMKMQERISPQIILSDAELEFVKKHHEITLSLDAANPPLNVRNQGNGYDGLSVDYAELIARKAGFQIRFVGDTWEGALRRALSYEVDGIMSAALKEDRLAYLNFTKPYYVMPLAVAVPVASSRIDDLSDLSGRRIAVTRGSVRVNLLKKKSPKCRIVEVESPEAGAAAILKENADAYFDDLPVVQYLIDGGFFNSLKIAFVYYCPAAGEQRFGLRNDRPELVTIFNKAIESITPEEHREIKEKWVKISEAISSQYDLLLTPEERNWIKKHPKIKFGADSNFAPIEWLNANGVYEGISQEYLSQVGKMIGLKFEPVIYSQWEELLRGAKERKVDMISAAMETPERQEYLNFTQAFVRSQVVFYSLTNREYLFDSTALKGKTIAVVKGYASEELIRTKWPKVRIKEVKDIAEGFREVKSGSSYAFVDGILNGTFYLSRAGDKSIKIIGDTPFECTISFGIRSDWPELVSIMNKALDAIPSDQKLALQSKWLSVSYVHAFDTRYRGIAIGISLLSLVMIVFLVLVIRKRTSALRAEEQRRRDRENALAASELRFRSLVESVHDLVFTLDAAGHLSGKYGPWHDYFDLTKDGTEALLDDVFSTVNKTPEKIGSENRKAINDYNLRALSGESLVYECRLSTKKGETFFQVGLSPLLLNNDAVAGIVGVARDITGMKSVEKGLIKSLSDKEMLIREIHHRVKNNLSIINSFLNIQKKATPDPVVDAALVNIQNRINSIALVHNKLYQRDDLQSVDLSEYCSGLIEGIRKAFGMEASRVAIEQSIPTITVLVETAIPCGLILNEIITNAIKYAFPAGHSGVISIIGEEADGCCRLVISDNGVGFSADGVQSGDSMGMKIIQSLVSQLKGRIDFSSNGGAVVSLSFPIT